ncbi:MAG: Rossmann-fold NAD(P)-binding domain-containing protein [Planctomycetota bacterium]|jgi:saccharopine dehydrogenase (NAD+, L-lysine-forming)
MEERTPLTPQGAAELIRSGFKVTVERSQQSAYDSSAYEEVGCEMVQGSSWVDAPEDAIILGLKELPDDTFPLAHDHIYFAHAYKEQCGWQDLLGRFVKGGSKLYDLEYLVDANKRRVAAFGYWAGFAGCAVSAPTTTRTN